MAQFDLAAATGRTTTQDRVTVNRSTTIPTDSRLNNLDSVRPQASMRNAERGSPEADAIRRALGMVDNNVSNLIDLNEQKFAKAEQDNAEVAAKDFATGQPNADLMQKSEAYRMVIADGRVRRVLTDNQMQIAQGVIDAVHAGAYADPTKGEHPFTLDDANAKFDEMVHGLLVDKDGKAIDYGDAGANIKLYQGIGNLRAQVMQQAANTIRDQEQTKALDAIGNAAISDLAAGKTDAIETGIKQAVALGIDATRAKSMLYHSVIDAAVQNKDESIIQKVIPSVQADGKTPTWNAAEKAELQQAYANYHNVWENERRQEATRKGNEYMGNLFPDMLAGKVIQTADSIKSAIQRGDITPEQATDLFQMQNAINSKKQQDIERSRSDTRWKWAQQEHSQAMANLNSQKSVMSLQASFFTGSKTQPEALKALDNMYVGHKLDDETYLGARAFLMKIPAGKALVSKYGADSHMMVLQEQIAYEDTLAAKGLIDGGKWKEAREHAISSFYTSLYSSSDPTTALQTAMSYVWKPSSKRYSDAIATAQRRSTAISPAQQVKNAQLDYSSGAND